ncbi:hypothetical protein PVAG01_08820 [Phlyctema vagabunda]|uniref:Altered inheritance of mitochondria protein 9, mitochondrial n=1 Tax=Phlyctema vagabunda TaxID=108571 RepID=A0ABR4PB86_9HELO
MEHAPGVQLHGLWPGMTSEQHMLTVKALARIIQSMATLPFPAYGSLYFADAPIDQKLKVPFGDFCIGPHCGLEFWDCTAGEARYYDERKPNRGPWLDLDQYCAALLDAGFSRIPNVAVAPKDELPYRGSIQEHLRLLAINEKVVPELIKSPLIQDLATPTLLHVDLNKRNIFVSENDPTVIMSVLDWQSTSIQPAFVYAKETSDLIPIRPPPISILADAAETSTEDLNEDLDEPPETPEEKKERERLEKDIWISRQTFEIGMKAWVPHIYAARVADDTLLRSLRYCSTSWRDSATAVRQELIELSQRWAELGLSGTCPYQPSPQELTEHAELYEQFQVMQRLKEFLIENFDSDSDGWIPPEAWEFSKEMHRSTFQTWMDGAREGVDPKLTVEIAEKLWPYDREKISSP